MIGFICSLLVSLMTALTGAGAAATALVPAAAQGTVDLTREIADLDSGLLVFRYQVREGVTGNGEGVRMKMGDGHNSYFFCGRYHEDDDMTEGPARATLRVRGGRIREIDLVVGENAGRPAKGAHDLGEISPLVAADWLLEFAAENEDGELAEEALLGAVIARDAEIAEPMIALARDRRRPADLRSSSLFWLALLAGEKVTSTITFLIEDDSEDHELREHAIFALGNLDRDTALPLLMEIARRHEDPRLQRSAFFSLAQFDDAPEVVALLEEILLGE